MPRPRSVSDEQVFEAIRAVLAAGGAEAATFAAVAEASGLSAPSLVQRYGTRHRMLLAASLAAWDRLDADTAAADDAAGDGHAGAVDLLMALTADTHGGDLRLLVEDMAQPDLRPRAQAWRRRVLAMLGRRVGTASAAVMFHLWQGAALWGQGRAAIRKLLAEGSPRAGR